MDWIKLLMLIEPAFMTLEIISTIQAIFQRILGLFSLHDQSQFIHFMKDFRSVVFVVRAPW